MKLFTAVYNDVRLLGHFLEHYRRAGISEFLIAVHPDFTAAVGTFASHYAITVVDDLDVADSFTGGVAAVGAMRQRFQGVAEWAVIVDLDEFIEFPDGVAAIVELAEREQANLVRAIMWDRFSKDGQVVGFAPDCDLRQVYPIRARFIKNVMQGTDYKGVLVKGLLKSVIAHHDFADQVVCSRELDLSHYKWFDGALDRVRAAHRMLSEAGRPWAFEYRQVLDHYETHGRFAWEAFGGEADPLDDPVESAAAWRDRLTPIIELSQSIPGWTRGEDAEAVAQASLALPPDAVIVEIGVFLGCCTMLLAGARQLRGSGIVHCVDPFDASGDAFSIPYYREIIEAQGGGPLRAHFEANLTRAGLGGRVQVHQGRAGDVAVGWTQPIDLLLLDGDQSPAGARGAYEAWEKFLKPGGTIVLRNTRPRSYAPGHDGHRRLAVEEIVPANYTNIRQIADTTIARKRPAHDTIGPARKALPAGRRRQRVHLYAQCWNDAFMLPFFFRHYDAFVDRYVIYDDGSSDRSLAILAEHPRVEIRRFVWSDPASFVLSEQALSNEFWKEARGRADWVIVTDLDEHLFHPHMADYLDSCAAAGVTAIPALGFQMLCDEPPAPGRLLCEAAPLGAPFDEMMKLSIFRPDAVTEINFQLGRHRADPVGDIRRPQRDEVLLLHYKYVGRSRTYARQRELLARLGERDLDSGWGYQYAWSGAELAEDWDAFAAAAVDIQEVSPDAHPIARWWRSTMSPVSVGAADRASRTPTNESAAPAAAPPSAPAARDAPPPYAKHFVALAEAIRRAHYRVEAQQNNLFRFRGTDLFLHPPAEGRTRLRADEVAPGAARAMFGCTLSLDQRAAGAVRFHVRVFDRTQAVAREATVGPGERREILLPLERFEGPLSVEFATEMAGGSGRNSFAWATFDEPRIHYLAAAG